jgi:hypothetical protein
MKNKEFADRSVQSDLLRLIEQSTRYIAPDSDSNKLDSKIKQRSIHESKSMNYSGSLTCPPFRRHWVLSSWLIRLSRCRQACYRPSKATTIALQTRDCRAPKQHPLTSNIRSGEAWSINMCACGNNWGIQYNLHMHVR